MPRSRSRAIAAAIATAIATASGFDPLGAPGSLALAPRAAHADTGREDYPLQIVLADVATVGGFVAGSVLLASHDASGS